jgi:HEAT repeat protein
MRPAHSPLVLLSSLLLHAAGCQTTVNGRPAPSTSDAEFEELSPFVVEQIEQTLRDMPYLRGKQVVDACAEIAKIGPSAIPSLRDAASDDESMRRVFVMNVLGAIGDRRALPTLQAGLRDSDPPVRYEAARACVRLGDWANGMPVLIEGLDDKSIYARGLCNDTLRRYTNLDFGYEPRGADDKRREATAKWRAWWGKHSKATLDMRS